jgi:hypothetical protein
MQMQSLHRENVVIEQQLRQIDRKQQWCQDEIGYDDD